ncbi:MAG: patatin family protein [Clostridia bacterium]|nr:patatin family protein [Clostridia bacterium]
MKKGLVMEGGAMRGMFTAGVCDVLLEKGIEFDGAVGVSAGAAFGCNFKSRQIGRAIRYNMRFCGDKRYWSISSLLKTGDIFNVDFCYNKLPYELDIFDEKTFNENPLEFHIVCTDVKTGLPHYEKCFDARESILWMRASASMPIVSRVVEINRKEYLDGGIVDAVPIKYFESIGYTKNIVILTRPYDYVKKKGRFNWIMKFFLRKYPAVYEGMKNRHKMYSETMEYINKKEAKGEIIVIRPETALNVKRTERNPENLKKAYDLGRKAAINRLEEIKGFLEG